MNHPVIALKKELLFKIVNKFKLKSVFQKDPASQILRWLRTTRNQTFFTSKKRATSWFLETVTLTTSPGFSCSKSAPETLKTLEKNVKLIAISVTLV